MKKHFTKLTLRSTLLLVGIFTLSVVKAADPVVFEAESAQVLYGNTKIGTSTFCSDGKYIGDMNASSYIRFTNIVAETAGTYELTSYYMTMMTRSVYMKVNKQSTSIVTFEDYSANWDGSPDTLGLNGTALKKSYIYLKAGVNTLEIGASSGWAPNFDKFELVKSDSLMAVPADVAMSFPYDLTDEAILTASITNSSLSNLTDNSELTIYKAPGVPSASFIAEFPYPVMLSNYLLSAGEGSNQDVSNWKLESSPNGTDWSSVGTSGKTDLNGAFLFTTDRTDGTLAAKYYRLTAEGDADVQVAEWQLFGLPYIANTDGKSFTQDLTDEFGFISFSAQGFYAPPAWDERYLNLFDRNMTTKYTVTGTNNFWVQYEPTDAMSVGSYTMTSTSDLLDRMPKSWTVSAFDPSANAGVGDWVEISSVTDFKFPGRYSTMKFYIKNSQFASAFYTAFKLNVTDNAGSGDISLMKWQLFAGGLLSDVKEPVQTRNFKIVTIEGSISIIQNGNTTGEYQVYNLTGRTVASGKISASTTQVQLPVGFYLVKITSDKNTFTEKILVK